jgi:hypothetical protein
VRFAHIETRKETIMNAEVIGNEESLEVRAYSRDEMRKIRGGASLDVLIARTSLRPYDLSPRRWLEILGQVSA